MTPTEYEALVFAFRASRPDIRRRLERVKEASIFSNGELAACWADEEIYRYFYKVVLVVFTDGTYISAGFVKWLGRRIVAIGLLPVF